MQNRSFTFVDLFSGIGGFHLAASQNGGKCLFACDIDEQARLAYEANYGIVPRGDITKINADDIPDHDLLCAGFPCQPFSIIGRRLGFGDSRGVLFFEIARILRAKRPQLAILENVKQLATHNKGETLQVILNTLQDIGYKTYWKVLNALDYGLPQTRRRTVIVCSLQDISFQFPEPEKFYLPLDEVLEKEVEKKYYVSEKIKQKRHEKHKSEHALAIWHENKSGHVSSYPHSCTLRAGASYNYLLVNGERRLTPREMLRLQGFPDSFKIVCSDMQVRQQAGNAIPVPMLSKIMRNLFHAASQVKR